MSLFSPSDKRHHREKYEEAESKKKSTLHAARFVGSLAGRDLSSQEKQEIYDGFWNNYGRAKRRLERLYAGRHKEALKLNKKYDTLVAQLERDSKTLEDFEREELGIRHNRDVKRHIGTTVGIISIASFILASILAVNITGNIIGANGNVSSNFIFLAIGFVFGIVWLVLRR